jgi:hypothetical protein
MVLAGRVINRLKRAATDPWTWVGSESPVVVAGGQSHRMALVHAIRSGRVTFPAAVLTHKTESQYVDARYWSHVERLAPEIPVAILWVGNELNARFLLEHDTPFTLAGLAEGTDKTVLPAELIKAFTLQLLQRLEQTLDQLSPRQVVLVTPPPPKSDETVRTRLMSEPFFHPILEKHGWSPATAPIKPFAFRHRLWEIHLMALTDVAERHKVPLLPLISEAFDEAGALRDEYAAKDVSHANERYGALVWQAIAHQFGVATQ